MAQNKMCNMCGSLGKKNEESSEEKEAGGGIFESILSGFQEVLSSVGENISETLQKSMCGMPQDLSCPISRESKEIRETAEQETDQKQSGTVKVADLDGNEVEIPSEKMQDYQQWVSEVVKKSKESEKKKEEAKKQALEGKIQSAADLARIEKQTDKEVKDFAAKRAKELSLF